jgi:hypothetical protein
MFYKRSAQRLQTQTPNVETTMAPRHTTTPTSTVQRQLEDAATAFLRKHGINANGLRSSGKDGGKQHAFERRLLPSATGRMTCWKR